MIRQQRFVLGATARDAAVCLVVAGAIAAVVGVMVDPARTWPDLLLNGFYTIGLALAGMVFISLQYLSGAVWSANLRRVPEALMSALPIAGALMLGLFFGRAWLYPWVSAFFFARMTLFVVVWNLFAGLMRRASLRQDEDPSPIHHRRLVRYSAGFIVVFSISFSLASFDWIMSRSPDWSSTIFAVYMFAGLLVEGVAAITLGLVVLAEQGYLNGVVNENHLHDLGKLLFAFSTFWAYIWFSQYLLIWYGNLPEEAAYYVSRTGEHWIVLFLLNVVVNWVVPFLVLMPRSCKRNPIVLKRIAIVLLAGRWLDLYLAVMPETMAAPSIGVLDVVIVAGYGAIVFLTATRALAGAWLVPVNNPSFSESLAHRQ